MKDENSNTLGKDTELVGDGASVLTRYSDLKVHVFNHYIVNAISLGDKMLKYTASAGSLSSWCQERQL